MTDNNFIPKPAEDQAEFNNAFAFLERLNKLEYMIEASLMRYEFRDCFTILESYENELFFSFKKEDIEAVNKIKAKINNLINNNPRIGLIGLDALGNRIRFGGNKLSEYRNLLIELNKTLRQIKFKRGMGMPTRGEGKLF